MPRVGRDESTASHRLWETGNTEDGLAAWLADCRRRRRFAAPEPVALGDLCDTIAEASEQFGDRTFGRSSAMAAECHDGA